MRLLTISLLFLAFLTACSTGAGSGEESSQNADEPQEQETEARESGNQYTVTPMEPSVSYPDARIESMSFEDGRFSFEISGESYELGVQTPDAETKTCANSAKGQHIHLIVDDQPYAAKYEAQFDYEISDGEHHILAFLSRSYHESIKTDNAHVAVKANIENNAIVNSAPIEKTMLFYSRPKGVYEGADTENVMLDFYIVNPSPEGHIVRADINGEIHDLDTWQPYLIKGLPDGENTIKLTLLNKDGSVVDTDLNPVQRTFKLNKEPVAN